MLNRTMSSLDQSAGDEVHFTVLSDATVEQASNWDRFDLAISNFCLDRSHRASCVPDLSELSDSLVGEGKLICSIRELASSSSFKDVLS